MRDVSEGRERSERAVGGRCEERRGRGPRQVEGAGRGVRVGGRATLATSRGTRPCEERTGPAGIRGVERGRGEPSSSDRRGRILRPRNTRARGSRPPRVSTHPHLLVPEEAVERLPERGQRRVPHRGRGVEDASGSRERRGASAGPTTSFISAPRAGPSFPRRARTRSRALASRPRPVEDRGSRAFASRSRRADGVAGALTRREGGTRRSRAAFAAGSERPRGAEISQHATTSAKSHILSAPNIDQKREQTTFGGVDPNERRCERWMGGRFNSSSVGSAETARCDWPDSRAAIWCPRRGSASATSPSRWVFRARSPTPVAPTPRRGWGSEIGRAHV